VIPRTLITILVALGLFLPLVVCVLLGVEALLGAMGDATGQVVVQRFRLASLTVWVVNLVSLVLLLGLGQLGPPSGSFRTDETED